MDGEFPCNGGPLDGDTMPPGEHDVFILTDDSGKIYEEGQPINGAKRIAHYRFIRATQTFEFQGWERDTENPGP